MQHNARVSLKFAKPINEDNAVSILRLICTCPVPHDNFAISGEIENGIAGFVNYESKDEAIKQHQVIDKIKGILKNVRTKIQHRAEQGDDCALYIALTFFDYAKEIQSLAKELLAMLANAKEKGIIPPERIAVDRKNIGKDLRSCNWVMCIGFKDVKKRDLFVSTMNKCAVNFKICQKFFAETENVNSTTEFNENQNQKNNINNISIVSNGKEYKSISVSPISSNSNSLSKHINNNNKPTPVPPQPLDETSKPFTTSISYEEEKPIKQIKEIVPFNSLSNLHHIFVSGFDDIFNVDLQDLRYFFNNFGEVINIEFQNNSLNACIIVYFTDLHVCVMLTELSGKISYKRSLLTIVCDSVDNRLLQVNKTEIINGLINHQVGNKPKSNQFLDKRLKIYWNFSLLSMKGSSILPSLNHIFNLNINSNYSDIVFEVYGFSSTFSPDIVDAFLNNFSFKVRLITTNYDAFDEDILTSVANDEPFAIITSRDSYREEYKNAKYIFFESIPSIYTFPIQVLTFPSKCFDNFDIDDIIS